MANIHEITLDVKKSGQTINEPIVIRTDDTDDVIEVHVKQDGLPYSGMTSATFYGTKQDMTIIANDPATVNNDVITYSVPKEIANISGKIKNAYFMIDGKISTENFIITILKTVNFKGESKDYIPGLNSLTDKWNSTSKEWNTKLNGLDDDIKNLSMSDMLKQKMDKALADAETDYMTTFNKSVDNLNSVVSELSNKEDIATDKGKELDTAIDKVNQSIADVNAWLDDVQKEIITANDDFTKEQQKSVSDEIDKLKDSITSTQKIADSLVNQLNDIDSNIKAIDVPDLNAKVDSLDSQAKNIKNKYDALKAQLDLVAQNIGGVRTNLYTDTRDFDNPDVWGWSWSNWQKTGEKFNGLAVMTMNTDWGGLAQTIQAKKGETYTFSVYARYQSGIGKSAIYYRGSSNVDYTDIKNTTVSLNENWQRVTGTVNITADGPISPRIERSNDNANTLLIAGPKLEKGPTATDWCPNPSEIATNDGVQTAITNALGNYPTSSEVDKKISTGVGQAKTYAEQSIKDIIGAAPATLDTIGELADAVTKNKDGVQAINDGITKKADKTDVTALQNTVQTMITPISQEDYKALEDAGTVDPKIMYVIPDA